MSQNKSLLTELSPRGRQLFKVFITLTMIASLGQLMAVTIFGREVYGNLFLGSVIVVSSILLVFSSVDLYLKYWG